MGLLFTFTKIYHCSNVWQWVVNMYSMQKYLLIAACILGAVAVAAGALGSHALERHLSTRHLDVYHTAVRYLFYHIFAIALAVFIAEKTAGSLALYGGISFLVGILLFCGSLFLLSTPEITGISWRWLGPVTPVGGLAFIVGWVLLVGALFSWK